MPAPPTDPSRGIIGDGEARRRGEAFEMHGSGKPDTRPRNEDAGLRHLGRHELRGSAGGGFVRARVGNAGPVIGEGELDLNSFQTDRGRFRESARGCARQNDLIDLYLDDVAAERGVGAPSGKNFLGHRAGGVPGSRSHLGGSCSSWVENRAGRERARPHGVDSARRYPLGSRGVKPWSRHYALPWQAGGTGAGITRPASGRKRQTGGKGGGNRQGPDRAS